MHRVAKKLADGTWAVYVYQSRGGTLIRKAYGETREAAQAALERFGGNEATTVAGAVSAYQSSDGFKGLSASTQDAYTRYLKRFTDTFGSEQLVIFENYKTKRLLVQWRDQYAATPRGADYMMRAVGSFFTWCRGRAMTSAKPITDIKSLHRSNRSDLVWTEADLRRLAEHTNQAVNRAVLLACETGLRLSDLIALRWDQIDADTIQLLTSKTTGVAVIPLSPKAKEILAAIDRNGEIVLKGARGKPWTADGLKTEFQKAKTKAGLTLRFHDLRGTAATRFRSLGYTNEEIARAMGWSVSAVEVLMTRYVKNADVMRAAISRVNQKQNGLHVAKADAEKTE